MEGVSTAASIEGEALTMRSWRSPRAPVDFEHRRPSSRRIAEGRPRRLYNLRALRDGKETAIIGLAAIAAAVRHTADKALYL